MRVVEALDEIEYRDCRVDPGLEALPVEQLAFQGGEQTLADGIVETVANGSHREPCPSRLSAFAERERGVLAALTGMMNHSNRAPQRERQVERFQHQFGAQIGLDRAAHDPAAEDVEDHRQKEKARPGRNAGNIGSVLRRQCVSMIC